MPGPPFQLAPHLLWASILLKTHISRASILTLTTSCQGLHSSSHHIYSRPPFSSQSHLSRASILNLATPCQGLHSFTSNLLLPSIPSPPIPFKVLHSFFHIFSAPPFRLLPTPYMGLHSFSSHTFQGPAFFLFTSSQALNSIFSPHLTRVSILSLQIFSCPPFHFLPTPYKGLHSFSPTHLLRASIQSPQEKLNSWASGKQRGVEMGKNIKAVHQTTRILEDWP